MGLVGVDSQRCRPFSRSCCWTSPCRCGKSAGTGRKVVMISRRASSGSMMASVATISAAYSSLNCLCRAIEVLSVAAERDPSCLPKSQVRLPSARHDFCARASPELRLPPTSPPPQPRSLHLDNRLAHASSAYDALKISTRPPKCEHREVKGRTMR